VPSDRPRARGCACNYNFFDEQSFCATAKKHKHEYREREMFVLFAIRLMTVASILTLYPNRNFIHICASESQSESRGRKVLKKVDWR